MLLPHEASIALTGGILHPWISATPPAPTSSASSCCSRTSTPRGNGSLLEHHVGRFVADAEAIYSYEGTREINTLIVRRAITGESAFV